MLITGISFEPDQSDNKKAEPKMNDLRNQSYEWPLILIQKNYSGIHFSISADSDRH